MTETSETQPPANIQINFPDILKDATNFTDIRDAIASEIKRLKDPKGIKRIGFVSGGLVKDPKDAEDEKLQREKNSRLMREDVAKLREIKHIPVFASTDIFDNVWSQLDETKPDRKPELEKNMEILFDEILINCGITDVFMRSGYKTFKGAAHELETAKAHKLTIHKLAPTRITRVIDGFQKMLIHPAR